MTWKVKSVDDEGKELETGDYETKEKALLGYNDLYKLGEMKDGTLVDPDNNSERISRKR